MPAIYHFTDFSNLELMLDQGVVVCPRDAPTKVDVGNREIKDSRTFIDVPRSRRQGV